MLENKDNYSKNHCEDYAFSHGMSRMLKLGWEACACKHQIALSSLTISNIGANLMETWLSKVIRFNLYYLPWKITKLSWTVVALKVALQVGRNCDEKEWYKCSYRRFEQQLSEIYFLKDVQTSVQNGKSRSQLYVVFDSSLIKKFRVNALTLSYFWSPCSWLPRKY